MRVLVLVLCLIQALALGRAQAGQAGQFDYYVLALSWQPSWCAIEGDARGAAQCSQNTGYGWLLHGLWPQYHQGWPEYCQSPFAPPRRGETNAMADIMGSSGLAWHQWKKHGSCSGLAPKDYFATSRRAFNLINRPAILRQLEKPVSLPAKLIEQAFIKSNPQLQPDMVTITCRQGRIQEARICLSKTLQPVPCGRDVVSDCKLKNALLDPVR